jgi:hypothetical protein
MKKLLTFLILAMITIAGYCQLPIFQGSFIVATRTTVFGRPLPAKTLVLQLDSMKYWYITAGSASTGTLATTAKLRFTPLAERVIGVYNLKILNEDVGTTKLAGQYMTDGTNNFTAGVGFTTTDSLAALQYSNATIATSLGAYKTMADMRFQRADLAKNRIYVTNDSIAFKMSDVLMGYFLTNGNFTFVKSLTVTDTINFNISHPRTGTTQTFLHDISVTGDYLSDAGYNSKFGTDAGKSITTGTYNTFIGYLAGQSDTSGQYNTAVGSDALRTNSSGSYNVALGEEALRNNTIGDYNTAVGMIALKSNTTLGGNTACGYAALADNAGGDNTSVGSFALTENTSGTYNAAVGADAMNLNTTGSYNASLGGNSLDKNLIGANNVAIGFGAGYNSLDTGNIFLGYQAGYNETGSNKLYIANSNTATPLIKGAFPNDSLIFTADHSSFSGNITVTDTVKFGSDTLYQYATGTIFAIERGNAVGNTYSGLTLTKAAGDAKAWLGTSFSSIQVSDAAADTDIEINGNTEITGDLSVTDTTFTNTISPYSGTTTTFPQILTVEGNTNFGNAATDLTTITGELTASDTAKFDNYVGINLGVATPVDWLNIRTGLTATMGITISDFSATTTDGGGINLRKSHSNTLGTLTPTVNGDVLGFINFIGVTSGSTYFTSPSILECVQNGAAGANGAVTDLKYSTISSAGGSGKLLRFIITNAGKIGIAGGVTASAPTTPTFSLSFSGTQAETIGVEAATTSAIGNSLTISSGPSGPSGSDKNCGDMILSTAKSDGIGVGDFSVLTTTGGAAGGTATTDYSPAEKFRVESRQLIDNNMSYTGAVPNTAGSFIQLTDAKAGICFLSWGTGSEYATIAFTTAGVVTLVSNSANVVNTQTNDRINVIDGGTQVYIINEMGSTATVTLTIIYNQ